MLGKLRLHEDLARQIGTPGAARDLHELLEQFFPCAKIGREQRAVRIDNDDERQLRSEEHTSELQSPDHLVCRLLLEKKKMNNKKINMGFKPTSPTMSVITTPPATEKLVKFDRRTHNTAPHNTHSTPANHMLPIHRST